MLLLLLHRGFGYYGVIIGTYFLPSSLVPSSFFLLPFPLLPFFLSSVPPFSLQWKECPVSQSKAYLRAINQLLHLPNILDGRGEIFMTILRDENIIFDTKSTNFPVLIQGLGIDVL